MLHIVYDGSLRRNTLLYLSELTLLPRAERGIKFENETLYGTRKENRRRDRLSAGDPIDLLCSIKTTSELFFMFFVAVLVEQKDFYWIYTAVG